MAAISSGDRTELNSLEQARRIAGIAQEKLARDVVILASRSFPGLTERPTVRLLAWDVIGGSLAHIGEVGPVSTSEGGFTGAFAL